MRGEKQQQHSAGVHDRRIFTLDSFKPPHSSIPYNLPRTLKKRKKKENTPARHSSSAL
jgi:hypothetical protein